MGSICSLGARNVAPIPLVGLIAALSAAPVGAQRFGAEAVTLHARHELLGTMFGVAIHVGAKDMSRSSWRFDAARNWGTHRRTGTRCVGFAPLGCEPDEQLRDHALMTMAALSFVIPVLHSPQTSVQAALGAAAAVTRVDTYDAAGSRVHGASALVVGPRAGVQLRWQASSASRYSIATGLTVGILERIGPDELDGYQPFGGIGITSFSAGVVWLR